jgi:hypothetical protein
VHSDVFNFFNCSCQSARNPSLARPAPTHLRQPVLVGPETTFRSAVTALALDDLDTFFCANVVVAVAISTHKINLFMVFIFLYFYNFGIQI